MHNLIIDQIKLNDNIDDHFEDLQKSHRHIFEKMENTKDNDLNWEINNETSLEKKNQDLDKKLLSLYKFHSSKFHKNKDVKLKDDLLHMRVNLLKKSEIEKINSKNNNSISKLRQDIAFKFRFLNSINNNNITFKKRKIGKFKKQDEKMKKILKISKSIPDILFKEIKEMKINNPLYKNNYINLKLINNKHSKNKTINSNRVKKDFFSLNKTNKLYEKKNYSNRNTTKNIKDDNKSLVSRVLIEKPRKNIINKLNPVFS